MGSYRVGEFSEIPDGGRIIASIPGHSVAVFRLGDRLVALENMCKHQGGPACEGIVVPAHMASADSRGSVKEFLDPTRPVVACPWHGWEYDLNTGTCLADPSIALRSFAVRVDGDSIYVDED